MKHRLEQSLTEVVIRLQTEFPELIAIYLFGSSGTEYERPDSNLDLAVYAGGPLPVTKLWYLAQEIASVVGREVDVLDLAAASTVMRAQVIHEGKRIYCSDEVACETFEDYTYSSYARLNEERRGILRDVLRRGSVHG
ncbi:type II toxin-antitoxin system antitoxin [soil metagenome]|jgi:predicted nucleotidyltransferase